MRSKLLKIAHRGASGTEPENTLRSFRKAIQLKVDMIECDVHLTKDQRVVVIHDETVDRTTHGKSKVSELTLAAIRKLDAGKGEKIPTLEETIRLVKNKCRLNVEVKEVNSVERVVEIISCEKIVSGVMISSSIVESLIKVKQLNPRIETALIYKAMKTSWGQVLFDAFAFLLLPITKRMILWKARKAGAETINLGKRIVTSSLIDYLHGKGLKVMVWTVDEEREMQKLQSRGVEGIFSNFPERFG